MPVDPRLGPALYELISGRYEKRVTARWRAQRDRSNKSLTTWGEIIGGDTALMMAILDRLLHHGEVFYLRGSSHRLHGKEAVLSPMTPVGQEPPPSRVGCFEWTCQSKRGGPMMMRSDACPTNESVATDSFTLRLTNIDVLNRVGNGDLRLGLRRLLDRACQHQLLETRRPYLVLDEDHP